MTKVKDPLNQHVLMLNKNWVVIATTTVQNAITLLCRESAKALCTTSFVMYSWEDWISEAENIPSVPFYIKTPNMDVPAPQVIILTNYKDIHLKNVKFSPRALYRRDNYTCQYCNKKMRAEKLSVDHVIPKSRSGQRTWANCVTSCLACNGKKADRTPKEAGFSLRTKPVRPKWNPVIHIKRENRPEAWSPLLKKHW